MKSCFSGTVSKDRPLSTDVDALLLLLPDRCTIRKKCLSEGTESGRSWPAFLCIYFIYLLLLFSQVRQVEERIEASEQLFNCEIGCRGDILLSGHVLSVL
jgi:hypothetical protein